MKNFISKESMQYHQNYKNISWEKLEEKIKKTDFKDIKDLRKKYKNKFRSFNC